MLAPARFVAGPRLLQRVRHGNGRNRPRDGATAWWPGSRLPGERRRASGPASGSAASRQDLARCSRFRCRGRRRMLARGPAPGAIDRRARTRTPDASATAVSHGRLMRGFTAAVPFQRIPPTSPPEDGGEHAATPGLRIPCHLGPEPQALRQRLVDREIVARLTNRGDRGALTREVGVPPRRDHIVRFHERRYREDQVGELRGHGVLEVGDDQKRDRAQRRDGAAAIAERVRRVGDSIRPADGRVRPGSSASRGHHLAVHPRVRGQAGSEAAPRRRYAAPGQPIVPAPPLAS